MLNFVRLMFGVFAFAVIVSAPPGGAADPPPGDAKAKELERWKEDLRHLTAELPRRHPNLFHTVSRERFEAAASALEQRLPALSSQQTIIELARLTAMIGELHTGIVLHRQPRELLGDFRAFPIRLHLFADGLFVQAIDAAHADVVGAAVIAIGDQPWSEALRRIGELVPADNGMGRSKHAPVYLSVVEALEAVGISLNAGKVSLRLRKTDGLETSVTLTSVPLPQLLPLLNPDADPGGVKGFVSARDSAKRPVPLWLEDTGQPYWYRVVKDDNTVYARIDVMRYQPGTPLKAFFAKVLAEIDRLTAPRLIIDIRGNRGGDNLALPLIEGLIARLALNQPGKLMVIVGRGTVSSGQNLATLLERYTSAVFIGEPTAQRPNHYGVMERLTLPNSRLNMTYSRYLLIDSDPDDVRPWLAPDVDVRLTSRDYAENRDPVLEAALSYVAQPKLPLAEILAGEYLPKFTIEPLVSRYRVLRPRFLSQRRHMESELLKLGHNLLAWGRGDDAVKVLELNLANEPESYLAHAALSHAYAASGKQDQARQSWNRALELNPWIAHQPHAPKDAGPGAPPLRSRRPPG